MSDEERSALLHLYEQLSEREHDVLRLIVEQRTNQEIANTFVIALSTAKWHVRQVFNKLGINNRQEAITFVTQLNLLQKEAVQHNLPAQTIPFVGRQSELTELSKLMTNARLVTILAPGGMGKTHLALEVARRQLNRSRDGAFFVALQPLTDPAEIIPQIAASMGISGEITTAQAFAKLLRDRHVLLILDNFEHLVDGSLLINGILEGAPHVQILVTSRQRLHLYSETVYVLGKLSSDAIDLFVQTAKRVHPHWELTEENTQYVVELCHLTDGMPLAILLAASWVNVYSVEKICAAVKQNVDFLSTGMADVPHSIKTIFDVTWERLKPSEQQLFMKMSVFYGGCEINAAEAIANADPATLQSLIDKALLSFDGRYTIHELLRQYAERMLDESGEADTIREAHALYYSRFVAEHDLNLGIYSQFVIGESLEADFDNIRSAWKMLLSTHQYDAVAAMILPLYDFTWLRQHRWSILRLMCENALSMIEREGIPDAARSLYGRVLIVQSVIVGTYLRDRVRSLSMAEKSLEILQSTDDEPGLIFAQHTVAHMWVVRNLRIEEAYDLLERVKIAANRLGYCTIAGLSLNSQALCLRQLGGKLSACDTLIRQGIEVLNDNHWFQTNLLRQLAENQLLQGDYPQFRKYIEDGQPIVITEKLFPLFSHVTGDLNLIQGNLEAAEQHYRQQNIDGRQTGDLWWASDGIIGLADTASLAGLHDQARYWLKQGEILLPELRKKWYFIWLMGKLAFRRGDFSEALEHFEVNFDHAMHKDPVRVWLDVGLALVKLGRQDKAKDALCRGLRLALDQELRLYYAQGLCGLAELYINNTGWATEIASMVFSHPVSPYEWRIYVQKLLNTPLPPFTQKDSVDLVALDNTVAHYLNTIPG